jgi:hypothetical protein
MIKVLVLLVGTIVGRFLVGGTLAFIFGTTYDSNGNPEEKPIYSWIGMLLGALIAGWIYKSTL